jgi:hypothetical protein
LGLVPKSVKTEKKTQALMHWQTPNIDLEINKKKTNV